MLIIMNVTLNLCIIIINILTLILFHSIIAQQCKCNHFHCEPPVIKSVCVQNKGLFLEADVIPNTRQICICCDYCVYSRKKGESCKLGSNPSNIINCEKNLICDEFSKKCATKKQSTDTTLLLDPLNKGNTLANNRIDNSDVGLGPISAKSLISLLGFSIQHITDHLKLAKSFQVLSKEFKENNFFKSVKFYFSKLNPQQMMIVIKALLLLPLKNVDLLQFDKLLGNLQVTKLNGLLKLLTQNGLNNMKLMSDSTNLEDADAKCKPAFDIDYAVIGHIVRNGITYEVQRGSSIRGSVELDEHNILFQDPDFEIINTIYNGKYIKRIQGKQNLCKTEKNENKGWTVA